MTNLALQTLLRQFGIKCTVNNKAEILSTWRNDGFDITIADPDKGSFEQYKGGWNKYESIQNIRLG